MQDILILHLIKLFTHLEKSFNINNIETLNVLFNTRNMWKLHVFVSSWSSIVEYVKKKFITLTSDKTIYNTIFTNGIMYYENHYLLTGTIKDNISDSVWNV